MCNFVCYAVKSNSKGHNVLRVSRLLIIYGFIVYSYKKVVKPSTLFNCHGLQFLEAEF